MMTEAQKADAVRRYQAGESAESIGRFVLYVSAERVRQIVKDADPANVQARLKREVLSRLDRMDRAGKADVLAALTVALEGTHDGRVRRCQGS